MRCINIFSTITIFTIFKDKIYNENVSILERLADIIGEALEILDINDKIPIGIIYQKEKKPYHEALYEDFNPIKNSIDYGEGIKEIKRLLLGL